MVITQVAIKDHNGMIYALDKPNRHHDIIRVMAKAGVKTPITGEQGFIDPNGRFVNRIEAAAIAIENKQIKELDSPPNLFSEDLW